MLVMCVGAALAQTETGQISGTVTDPAGALVAGATITVRSVDRGAERTVTTGEDGNYQVTNLQPGVYEVTATGTGFQATAAQRVQVTVGGRPTLDIQFGQVTSIPGETVDVVASGGVEINTQTQELSDVVSGNQVRELPTVSRNPYALVELSGNVSSEAGGSTDRGTGFSINGQRAASTNILLDGSDNNNTFSATVGQSIPLDAVQEFRVISSNFSAEYGRASGGIVNVATRAGSNDFNGSIYEFNRISRLASNGFDNNARGAERAVFTRNQFGYAVGGRIIRDKLFFFNSTEFLRVRSTGPAFALVPTAQFLALTNANTRNFFSGYTLAATPTGRQFTVGELSGTGANGLNLPAGNAFAALPASTVAFQEVQYSVPTDFGGGDPQNSYQTVTRIDYNLSDRTQIYGRYALEKNDLFEGSNASSPYAGFSTGSLDFNQNALINLTHTFTPNLVSQSKLVFNRLNNSQPLGDQPNGPTLYLRNTVSRIGGTRVAFPGYLPFSPGSAIPFGGPQNLGQVFQDFNYTAGKQTIRFGGQYVYIQDNRAFGAYANSVETLGTSFPQALANLVNGQLLRFETAINPQGNFPGQSVPLPVSQPQFTRSNRYNEFAVYANDAIRIHPRVTMNLGLRYENYGVQRNKDQRLDSNFYLGAGDDPIQQIRNGRVQIAQDSPLGGLYRRDNNNFAPRFGLAWDVSGDGRTSLRGGYGVAYERNFGNVTFNVIQNPPNYAVIRLTSGSAGTGTIPITTSNLGPFAGGPGAPPSVTLPATTLRALSNNLTNAYAHFYSISFEREVVRNTVASVEYSGSAGRDLYSIENPNRVGSGAVYLGLASPTSTINSQYSSINLRGNSGFSNYNALIASLDSSNFRSIGLQFTARYTYSVTKDNLSSTFSESSNNFNLGLLDPFDPRLDYGYADFDVRHRFVGSFNYEVPFFNNIENSVLRNILGGFTFTGIVNAQTGTPFSIFDCTNAAFEVCPRLVPTAAIDTDASQAIGVVSGAPNRFQLLDLSNQTAGTYINPLTGTSEFGPFPANMTARNAFRGPGFYNIDAGLYKRIRITEGTSLQLRAEVFNVLNHANLFVVGEDADVSSFDYVPGRRLGRRNVQLAVKFLF